MITDAQAERWYDGRDCMIFCVYSNTLRNVFIRGDSRLTAEKIYNKVVGSNYPKPLYRVIVRPRK